MNNLALIWNRVLLLGLLVLLGFLAWFFSDIVAYLMISAVLWFILTPLVNFLDHTSIQGKSLPRWLATLLSMVSFIVVVFLLSLLFIPMAIEQAAILGNIEIDVLIDELAGPFERFENWLIEADLSEDPRGQAEIYIQDKVIGFFGQVGDVLGYIFSLTGNLLTGTFAVAFITFFFLKDESLVKRIILGATPDRFDDQIRRVLSNAKRLLSRYFIGLILQISLISTLVTVGLSILGVENALLIGLFAGFINVIPYIGPLIGMVFGLFIVFTGQIDAGIGDGTTFVMWMTLIIFLIVQTCDNIIFQPLIFSNSVNAHPLEIFLIIFIAGKLGGIVGMICAIPGYTLIRIIAKEFLTQFKIVQNLTKNI